MADGQRNGLPTRIGTLALFAGVASIAIIGGFLGKLIAMGFSTLGNTALAAVLGAAVGTSGAAIVAFLMEMLKWDKAKRDRLAVEDKEAQVVAKVLMFKLTEIYMNVVSIHEGILEDTKERSAGLRFASIYVRVPLSVPQTITLTTAEMVLIYDLDADLLMDFMSALDDYNQTAVAMVKWRTESAALFDGIPVELAGNPVELESHLFESSGYALLRMDNLIQEITTMAEANRDELKKLVRNYGEVIKTKLSLDIPIEIYDAEKEKVSEAKEQA